MDVYSFLNEIQTKSKFRFWSKFEQKSVIVNRCKTIYIHNKWL